jgi:hypothetical protein
VRGCLGVALGKIGHKTHNLASNFNLVDPSKRFGKREAISRSHKFGNAIRGRSSQN